MDDDPKLSRLVRTILEKTGLYEVKEENRSSTALATARAFAPDMILLDVDMPGKDGGEVARELQSDPALSQKPVLFLLRLFHTVRQASMRWNAAECYSWQSRSIRWCSLKPSREF